MLLYIWLIAIVAASWLYLRRESRFAKHGVKHQTKWETFVNMFRIFMRTESFADEVDRVYKAFPGERFVGRYEFTRELVMITDIELVKKVTIKDFEHFIDHRTIVDDNTDNLFGRNLFALKGQEWKDMRSTLSPAFTSSKMRQMLPFMVEVGKQMTESLKTKINESKNDYIDIDVKDLCTRCANDVIATCAYGLKINSHVDRDNEFYKMGEAAVNFGGFITFFKFFFLMVMPKVMSKFNIYLFNQETKNFFKDMVANTMKDREARNIIRPDMIHLLMEAKKGRLVHEDNDKDADAGFATAEESNIGKKNNHREWSDNDLTAQVILFFIAGFDTVSSAMAFALHELAVHPEVQERLVQEIRETDAKTGGKFNYSSIQSMKYMDMVVSEVLRLWPSVHLDRVCIKDYNLGKPNDDPEAKDYYIRAGEGLAVPIYSIHRDSKYFPDPLKFDPERFSDENKHKIQPFTYLPFGTGPRNCLGSRFALCEVKVILYQVLLNLHLSPNEKTCIPAELDPKSFNFSLKGGHWLRLSIRK